MKKTLIAVVIGIVIGALFFGTTGFASGDEKQITVDFTPLKFFFSGVEKTPGNNQSGFIYEGTTYVPLRFIAESLGQPVEWDGSTNSIYIGTKKSINQKIIIGSDATFEPFEFRNNTTGNYEGFDIDIIKAAANAAGLGTEIKNLPFDELIPSLQSGQIDAIVSGMSITEPRKTAVSFTYPYFESGLVIAVRNNDNTIESLSDLRDRNVGVVTGTTAEYYTKQTPCVKVHTYSSIDHVFDALKQCRVDAVINDYPTTARNINRGNAIKIVDKFSIENLGFAVSKDNPELLAKLNKGLSDIRSNGEYERIYKKWFGI